MSELINTLVPLTLSFFSFSENVKMYILSLFHILANNKYTLQLFAGLLYYVSWLVRRNREKKYVINEYVESDHLNPIYTNIMNYISRKFREDLDINEVSIVKGKLSVVSKDVNGKVYKDTYKGVEYKIWLVNSNTNVLSSSMLNEESKQAIIIQTASSKDEVLEFIKFNCVSGEVVKNIDVYVLHKRSSKKKSNDDETERVNWVCNTTKTNKTLQNTIYRDEVIKSVFDDINYFFTHEEEYARKGIPYKRGYYIYGPPGTGKTSIAKILAAKYNMDIFCLDLNIVKSNDVLNSAIAQIAEINSSDKPYMILIEDFERTKFVKESRYSESGTVTIDAFLNFLDGVTEPHGRIVLITGNNPECILENNAYRRPGRIDKIVVCGECNLEQVIKLMNVYYEVELEELRSKVKKIPDKLVPCDVINYMQSHTIEDCIKWLTGEVEDCDNDEEEKEYDNDDDPHSSRRSRHCRRSRRSRTQGADYKMLSGMRKIAALNKRIEWYKSNAENLEDSIKRANVELEIAKKYESKMCKSGAGIDPSSLEEIPSELYEDGKINLKAIRQKQIAEFEEYFEKEKNKLEQ
jgi:ATP-dependent 26S proteasome regulatory subunit